MREKLWIGFVVLALATTVSISMATMPDAKEKKTMFSNADEAKYNFNNPLPWLEMGADIRFRMIRERARKLDNNKNSAQK